MCQINKRFLLAKKVLHSPGVGAYIQPGIKAFMDEEALSAGTEAWHQGLDMLKEASSLQLGSMTLLFLSGLLAMELCTTGSTLLAERLTTQAAAAPCVTARCFPEPALSRNSPPAGAGQLHALWPQGSLAGGCLVPGMESW